MRLKHLIGYPLLILWWGFLILALYTLIQTDADYITNSIIGFITGITITFTLIMTGVLEWIERNW